LKCRTSDCDNGDAALRAVDERDGPLEADRRKDRTERLTGLGGIDGQRLASKVFLAIFRRLRPFPPRSTRPDRAGSRTSSSWFASICWYSGTAEQLEVIEHMIGILRHGEALSRFRPLDHDPRLLRLGESRERSAYSAAIRLGFGTVFQGALAIFQIGALIAISMSRAKNGETVHSP